MEEEARKGGRREEEEEEKGRNLEPGEGAGGWSWAGVGRGQACRLERCAEPRLGPAPASEPLARGRERGR